jgi:photosystem II stability/assembly factor-like uncharacterized protein
MGISLSPTARDLIRSTFFGKDFDTYRQEIIDSINAVFGPDIASNIVASEQGIMLIELNAFGLSTLSWYGDRQADDTNLRDARLRFAAVTVARQLGYKAHAAVPAVANVNVLLATPPPVQLIIPKGQQAAGPQGLVFETTADVVFDVGQIGSGLPAGLTVSSLVVNPSTTANILAGTSTGIFQTPNSGISWGLTNSGLTTLNVTTLVIDPSNPLNVYAGTITGGVFKSFDGGNTWSPQNAGLSNLKILSLAIDPITTANLYVGTNGGGVFKSINGASSWTPVNGGIVDFVIQTLAIDPITTANVYAGTYSQGVFKTTNGGLSWNPTNTGLGTLNISDLAINPTTPIIIYAATNGGGMYQTTTGGTTWFPINNGLTSVVPTQIAIDPGTPTTVYIGTSDSGVFKTVNSGGDWASFSVGITPTDISSITINPSTTSILYAGTIGGGIYGSTNSALTWTSLNTGINDPIKTVAMREGRTLQETFKSDGTPNQTFELTSIPTGMSIAQSTPVITIGGINWPEVTLLTYQQTNQVEIEYGFNPPRVIFGDGVAGNIPPQDAQIVVNYFATSGTSGAVASNTILAFIGPIIAGITPIGSAITNPQPSTPGSDPESIDSIKINAPNIFQAAQRAVTKLDLDAFINSYVDPTFGAVAKGRATTPRSVSEDAEALSIIATLMAFGVPSSLTTRLQNYFNQILSSNCEANVVIAQILAADSIGRYVVAPVGLVSGLETFLNSICESTVRAIVADGSVNLLSVNVTVTVGVLPTYTSTILQLQVGDAVRTAVQNLLIGRDFGISLRIADLYNAVDAVTGVNYSDISLTVTNNLGVDISASRLNQFGDLLIQDYEVITMGATPSVQVTTSQ